LTPAESASILDGICAQVTAPANEQKSSNINMIFTRAENIVSS
jgi:hypothetical protein